MARRKGKVKNRVPGAFGRDLDRGRGFSSLRDALQNALEDKKANPSRRDDERSNEKTDPWAILAEAAVKRLRFALLGYFPSSQGKLLAYEAGSNDNSVRVVLATPDVQSSLGKRLPAEFSPAEMPASIAAAMAEMQRLEQELEGPLSFWHEIDELFERGEVVRLGLPEMEDPIRPHRRGPFGFAYQRDQKGVARVTSVFNPKALPGAPKVGQSLAEVRRMANPSVGRKLLALAERWGHRLSEEVARRTR